MHDDLFDPEDRLLTDEEAAPLIGVKPARLPTMRSQGRGPRYVKDGRLVRYTPRFIKEYLAGCIRTPEPAAVRRQRRALKAESSNVESRPG
jgi:hypothetical protein